MRVLVTSNPGYGHLIPMLPLVRAAQAAGHDVVVATGPDLTGWLEARGVSAWPVGPTHAGSVADFRARHPEIAALPAEERMFHLGTTLFVEARAAPRAVDLVPRAEAWEPELVVAEPSEFAGYLAAARTGAPLVVHGLGTTPPPAWWEPVTTAVRALSARWDVPDVGATGLASPYLDICPPSLRPPWPPLWPDTRPLRPSPGDVHAGERLPDGLDRLPYGDTVYVTLGTVVNEAPGVLAAAVAGVRELPVNVVATVGPGVDPAVLGDQPAHVLVTDFLPQALMLARCRAVVSHGGAGTIAGAFAFDLPQLLLPQGADQFLGAATVAGLGAGLVLRPEEISAEAVGAAVRRLLAEDSFTAAARRVRAELEAMPAAGEVLAGLTGEAQGG